MPLVKKKFNRKKDKVNDWITPAILKSVNKKNRLYAAYHRLPFEHPERLERLRRFKEYENLLNKVIRARKADFYNNQFANYNGNIKKTWQNIKNLLNKNQKPISFPTVFIDDKGEGISDPQKIANSFNDFFTDIGPNLAKTIDTDGKPSAESFLPNVPQDLNFSFAHTTREEVRKIIMNLTSKPSAGDDEVSAIFLKDDRIIDLIVSPLTKLINQSLDTGVFPDALKIAKVIPLFKEKGDDFRFENYRPVSLLSIFSKVYERVVFYQLYGYFNINNLFYRHQYGFRKEHSTEGAAIELIDRVLQDLDKNEDPFAIFLDLSKAFDTIDHGILLKKLSHYGIRGTTLNWFESYLSNRTQYVSFKNIKSRLRTIITGVPQGSILGPLLFIIYINDIKNSTTLFDILGFADDTTLYGSVKRFKEITLESGSVAASINKEIAKVSDWLAINKLSLNASKTKQMHFFFHQDSTRNICTENPNIQTGIPLKINDQKINRVNKFNFLGTQITSTLSWKAHTDFICAKISKNVGMLRHLKKRVPFGTLKMLYNTLIHSYLNHGILAWGFSPGRLVTLQNKAIRAITRSRYNAHAEPLYKKLRILRVAEIFLQRGLKFYYWMKNNEVPQYFQEMFRPAIEVHGHNTRGSQNIHIVNSRTVGATKCLRYFIPETIEKFDRVVLDKVQTHSPDGFSKFTKFFMINQYSETPCLSENRAEPCEFCLRERQESRIALDLPVPMNII